MADDGAIFDAIASIVSALEIAELVNLLGADAAAQAKLRAAHEGLELCLNKTASRAEAISEFERFLRKKGESFAFLGEIFCLVVDRKPFETPQSIKDKGSGPPQFTTDSSPVAKSPSVPKPPSEDPIDQLFADFRAETSPKKGAAPARTPRPSSPASSPDGRDAVDRLFNQSGTPSPPHNGSHGDDGPDEIDELFAHFRP